MSTYSSRTEMAVAGSTYPVNLVKFLAIVVIAFWLTAAVAWLTHGNLGSAEVFDPESGALVVPLL